MTTARTEAAMVEYLSPDRLTTFTAIAGYAVPASIACALITLMFVRPMRARQARFYLGAYADIRLWSVAFTVLDACVYAGLVSAILTCTGVTWAAGLFAILIAHVLSPGFMRIFAKHAPKPAA
jgi:hypothetical protein